MKVIKPFFLGTLGGLVLATVLLVGLYFSPLRENVYFRADPEMADVRAKLSQYRDWLSQADLYIVEKGPATSDSLQTAQTLAWREYKKWRTHLGELARAHTRPTAEGFWTWTYSLRYWALPIGIFVALFPAFWLGWRARRRFRPGKVSPQSQGARTKAQNEAMTSFEDAVKKIARISDLDRKAVPVSAPDLSEDDEPPSQADEPPVVPITITTLYESPDKAEPETNPFPIVTGTGLETNFLQTGSIWGEAANATLSDNALIDADGNASGSAGLSMEDEDGDIDEEESLGVMPPTTEVERVERRKAEVLKLARKGLTSSEISRRMRISQDQVEFIIRLRREKG